MKKIKVSLIILLTLIGSHSALAAPNSLANGEEFELVGILKKGKASKKKTGFTPEYIVLIQDKLDSYKLKDLSDLESVNGMEIHFTIEGIEELGKEHFESLADIPVRVRCQGRFRKLKSGTYAVRTNKVTELEKFDN